MKKFIALLTFMVVSLAIQAQILTPVKWKISLSDSDTAEKTLVFSAKLDNGWHLYDMNLPEGGPVSTSFAFDKLEGAEVVGDATPSKEPTTVFDPQFNMELRWFAKEAFAVSSHYDSAIFNYFDGDDLSAFRCAVEEPKQLRYGENPHQKGYFFGNLEAMFDQIHGKEISYNNLIDINAAVDLIDEFDEITFAILKHNNACGLASRPTLLQAWKDALAGDPVSAFGGVLVTNESIDKATAEEINKIFFEVIIAPDYDMDALQILEQKKNRIILVRKDVELPKRQFRSLLNGVLVQDRDLDIETRADLKPATEKLATDAEIEDMLFANKIVKNSKSNAIVLAKDKQLLASGVGQTSRVDALKQAIEKAHNFGFDLHGAVMASDAFFPFGDCVEIAGQAGVTAVIQPGGSIRDAESVDYCNAHGMAMVMTGIRHFKH